ncbi:hypothetical protein D3C73_1448970 [compost metagenome]
MGSYRYPVTGQSVITHLARLATGGKLAVVHQGIRCSLRGSGVVEVDQLSAVREAGAGDAAHNYIIPQVTKNA